MHYDTIVLGLGAMGSAAVYQLAKRGNRVLGLDRFEPPHTHGSSHGETRVTRQAIGEGEQYSPLSLRSFALWREIERETGRSVLTVTGGLIISSPHQHGHNVADFFANTLGAARRFQIRHEVLDARQIRERFPQFNVQDHEVGYYEYNAGFLRPEECIRAQLELAVRHGATLQVGEQVLDFRQQGEQVSVRTTRGSYTAGRLVVSAGAWLPTLLGAAAAKPFRVMRQVLYWFDPAGPIAPYELGRLPVFIWEPPGTNRLLYGFPAIDGPRGGVKVASAQYEIDTTADTIDRTVTREEISAMYEQLVKPCFPGLGPQCRKTATCLYTITPDFAFVIDELPGQPRVLVASPCSGHGFKHSAAVGEALAEIVVEGRSRIDLSGFRWARFSS
ncbi:MAG: N-methyl-L-tryptophan oxidase [Verrucomicrobia bacterium]|nr:N-methyl-L-tryptophan oxidase [Verrucomicrobiota bacterium]